MALSNHPIDGSLCAWSEVIAERDDWSALLLGNGLSRHVWGDFGYPSLFDKAQQGDSPGSLTKPDLGLFEALSTKNFERVLADLAAAMRVAEALRIDPQLYVDRYQSIQRALGVAVRSVHVNRAGISDDTLEGIGP